MAHEWSMYIFYNNGDECVFNDVKYSCVFNNINRVPNMNLFDNITLSGFWEEA